MKNMYKVLKSVPVATSERGNEQRVLEKGAIYDDIPGFIIEALLLDKTHGPWIEEVEGMGLNKKTEGTYETKIEVPDVKADGEKFGWETPVKKEQDDKPGKKKGNKRGGKSKK